MQAIGNRGSIAQVMVVIEDGIRERLRHVAYLLGLSHEIKHTVLDKLQDIGHTIGGDGGRHIAAPDLRRFHRARA